MFEYLESHPTIITDALLPAVVAIAGLLWGIVKRWDKLADWKLTKAVECLEAGVQASYDSYVRAIKLASEDGRLTEEERKQARQLAIDAAKAYAASYGIDLVKTLGAEMLPVMIEKILSKLKGNTTVVAVPAMTVDDLPELEAKQGV